MQGIVVPEEPELTPLGLAVQTFNEQVKDHPIGGNQLPLTEAEVVASIWSWDRRQLPRKEILDIYRAIAKDRKFPATASFRTREEYNTYTHKIVVWWIDLHVRCNENGGWTHRVRDQKISSREYTAEEIKRFKGGPVWRDPE